MPRRKLLWQLYPSYLLITILSLIVVVWYSTSSMQHFYQKQTENDLKIMAQLVAENFKDHLIPVDQNRLEFISKQLGKKVATRITLILPSGEVIADSEDKPSSMDNHKSRPEVQQALSGEIGVSSRHSNTLEKNMIYVAVPVMKDDKLLAIVRTAVPVKSISQAHRILDYKILLAGIAISLITVVISFSVARRITRPLEELEQGARRFARGDLKCRLSVPKSKEIAVLAEAMNEMAEQLCRLEGVRRDFVANVSHELRTPITSIKGFVETLLDGASNDPEDTERFLKIILKHTDRLRAIIEDLLNLSRIEQDSDHGEILLEKGSISEVISAVIQLCHVKATQKNIEIEPFCMDNIYAYINPSLLEQAIVNLIDNAIKYSDEGSSIQLQAIQNSKETVIKVCDRGCGISKEHLPRLFERFYRVDKARSRKLGGTGLGLAIVKHIVQAHHGNVSVESVIGKGSVFSIHLPNELEHKLKFEDKEK